MSRYRPAVNLGPHLIDQALVLFGAPESIIADLQVQRAAGSAVAPEGKGGQVVSERIRAVGAC